VLDVETEEQVGSPIAKEYQNPPDESEIKAAVAIVIFCLFLGMGIAIFTSWPLVMVLFAGIGIVVILQIWRREYYQRPKSVKIESDGVRFFFRYGRPRLIQWQEIVWMQANPGNPLSLGSKRFGSLKVKEHLYRFALTYEIAQEIIVAYGNAMGRSPPIL
jgi:hypothetical protein